MKKVVLSLAIYAVYVIIQLIIIFWVRKDAISVLMLFVLHFGIMLYCHKSSNIRMWKGLKIYIYISLISGLVFSVLNYLETESLLPFRQVLSAMFYLFVLFNLVYPIVFFFLLAQNHLKKSIGR